MCKNVNFGEKNWNFVRNVVFLKQLCTITESEYLIGRHSYFQKIVTFVSNSDKNFHFFFRKCLYVHVFIVIKVFYLLENCYFDSKYHFIRWYFGQKCHFSNKIYISCGINSLEKSSNFLRKGVNLVVSFGENDVWFLK